MMRFKEFMDERQDEYATAIKAGLQATLPYLKTAVTTVAKNPEVQRAAGRYAGQKTGQLAQATMRQLQLKMPNFMARLKKYGFTEEIVTQLAQQFGTAAFEKGMNKALSSGEQVTPETLGRNLATTNPQPLGQPEQPAGQPTGTTDHFALQDPVAAALGNGLLDVASDRLRPFVQATARPVGCAN